MLHHDRPRLAFGYHAEGKRVLFFFHFFNALVGLKSVQDRTNNLSYLTEERALLLSSLRLGNVVVTENV